MKKAIVLILLMTLALCGDSLPENAHFVNKCVTITNSDQFSDYYFIGLYIGPMIDNDEGYGAYIISPNQCLHKGAKGPKFNSFSIYFVKKQDFDNNNTIETEEVSEALWEVVIVDERLTLITDDISPSGYFVEDSSSLISESLDYKLIDLGDTFKLVKHVQVLTYSDGTETNTYDEEEKVSETVSTRSSGCALLFF